MIKKVKKEVLNRTNYILGHLRAVKKMIEREEYCIDIIHQNAAVCEAIKKVSELILENHLNTCVTGAIRGKSEKERRKKLKELLEIYKKRFQ
ncbi:MAG: metal-sensing transcriptional repressor [Patescibacteria group bacterium]